MSSALSAYNGRKVGKLELQIILKVVCYLI